MYRGHDLNDLQRFNVEQEERYYYERARLAHLDSQAYNTERVNEQMSYRVASKVIATGSSSTEDSALEWLKLYGCEIEYCSGVHLIRLPENARLDKGSHTNCWGYTISFVSQFDDDETYAEVALYCDANETTVTLGMDDKYKGIRDYVASFFDFKYKDGVIIKYIKLEYIDKGDTKNPAPIGDYWEVTFNVVSSTEGRTIANVGMAFDFLDNQFIAIRPPVVLPVVGIEEPDF